MAVERRTVDLSAYPDLVVIYLGMRINALRGLKRTFGLSDGDLNLKLGPVKMWE